MNPSVTVSGVVYEMLGTPGLTAIDTGTDGEVPPGPVAVI